MEKLSGIWLVPNRLQSHNGCLFCCVCSCLSQVWSPPCRQRREVAGGTAFEKRQVKESSQERHRGVQRSNFHVDRRWGSNAKMLENAGSTAEGVLERQPKLYQCWYQTWKTRFLIWLLHSNQLSRKAKAAWAAKRTIMGWTTEGIGRRTRPWSYAMANGAQRTSHRTVLGGGGGAWCLVLAMQWWCTENCICLSSLKSELVVTFSYWILSLKLHCSRWYLKPFKPWTSRSRAGTASISDSYFPHVQSFWYLTCLSGRKSANPWSTGLTSIGVCSTSCRRKPCTSGRDMSAKSQRLIFLWQGEQRSPSHCPGGRLPRKKPNVLWRTLQAVWSNGRSFVSMCGRWVHWLCKARLEWHSWVSGDVRVTF